MPSNDPTVASVQPPPSRGMKFVVYGSLVAAVALALTLVASTGIRWMTQRTPSSILVFHANADLADSTISILGGDRSSERTAQIPKTSEFIAPIFLEPGAYTFTVKHAGEVVFHDSMYVAEGSRYDIDITHPAATQP